MTNCFQIHNGFLDLLEHGKCFLWISAIKEIVIGIRHITGSHWKHKIEPGLGGLSVRLWQSVINQLDEPTLQSHPKSAKSSCDRARSTARWLVEVGHFVAFLEPKLHQPTDSIAPEPIAVHHL